VDKVGVIGRDVVNVSKRSTLGDCCKVARASSWCGRVEWERGAGPVRESDKGRKTHGWHTSHTLCKIK